MRKVVVSIFLGLFSAFPHVGNANQIDLGSLLENMLDRSEIAEFPEIDFVCRQASSYDRLAVKPGIADWPWTDRTMYFHSTWRGDNQVDIGSDKKQDAGVELCNHRWQGCICR